jgi:hypothetical protein
MARKIATDQMNRRTKFHIVKVIGMYIVSRMEDIRIKRKIDRTATT